MTRRGCRRSAALAVGLAMLAGSAVLREAGGQTGRPWRPEERVLLSAFHELGAVATDMRRVYAASPLGLEVYDFVAGRWELPITAEDGYPVGEQPTALAYDRVEDALWLVTSLGSLYRFEPHFGRWEHRGLVPLGRVERIVPAMDGAVYLWGPGGWLRLRRGSSVLEPVRRGEAPAASGGEDSFAAGGAWGADPFLRALRGTLALDARLRRWPITAVAPAEPPGRYWVATRGGNLVAVDTRRMVTEWLPFGLLTRGVGTIAADGEELWFGGDGRGPRRGVTRADHSLQRWGHFEAQDGAPAGYVADVLPATGAVWFAASDGLYRHDRRSGRWRRLGESDGLPTAEATALAPAPTGLWVGTRRGVVALDDAGEVAEGPLLTGQTVYRLVASRDSLWIATDVGLWVLPAGAQAPVPAPGVENHPALRGPVIDVRPAFGSLFALTERGLYRFDGQSWRGPIAEAGQAGLGRLRALAAGDGQLWVGGDRGLARWDTETQLWTYYWVPADIPEGPVRRVLPAGEHVWLSTPAGALRLAWRR
mgnify:CR=1 FL=1|jgi:hypothetical protein